MIIFQVSIKEPARQAGIEGETGPTWQPVEKRAKNEWLIWRPTQEEEFSSYHGSGERQKEGVFIYPHLYEYPEFGGIKAVEIVSRGKAEVFIRQGENEMGLIRRGSLKTVTPEIMVVPDEGLGFEKQALIIFKTSGKPADLFLRVNGKFTAEARIECQEK